MKILGAIGCLVVLVGVAVASPTAPVADDKAGNAAKSDAAAGGDADAVPPHITGPQRVELGHHAWIDLPAGMSLFEQAAAQEIARKAGNNSRGVVAMIVPNSETAHWAIVINAEDVGYVSDSDASELDAEAMFEQFKQGTSEQNKERVKLGIPALTLDGWSERPRYEPVSHHLVWGLKAHDAEGEVVNFFTRVLGRGGFLSVDLIDAPQSIESSKQQALSILTAVQFTPGARYEDHVGGDRDSGLGLKALVLGGTGVVLAKKTGILIAILLALKKGIIVVIAAAGGFLRWLFRRKRAPSADLAPTVPSEGPAPSASPPGDPASSDRDPPAAG
jgi:uncharacterized membrane-anchored protein